MGISGRRTDPDEDKIGGDIIAEMNIWTVADDPGYPCRDCNRMLKDNCVCDRWRKWFCGESCVGIDGRREKMTDGAWNKVCAPIRELKKRR